MNATVESVTVNGKDAPHLRAALNGGGEILGGSTPEMIRRYADAILRIKGRISALQDDVAAEYAKAKSDGLDKKALAELVKRLMADPEELQEQSLMVATYETAYHSAGLRADA
jgi:uncharacterized protein (UPF0335 family)